MHVCADTNIGKLNERPLLKSCWGSYQSRAAHGCSSKLHVSNSISFSADNAQSHATTVQCQHVTAPKVITRHRFGGDQPQNASAVDILILEHTKSGCHEEAVRVYLDFISAGSAIDGISSFSTLIKAVGDLRDIQLGRQFHGHFLKLGTLDDIYNANALLGMFWKCGMGHDADKLFERVQERDLISWNTMISGLHKSMRYAESLELFRSMVIYFGMYPNHITCISALSSCGSNGSVMHGREIHGYVIKHELDHNKFVVNGLLEMYMKHGNIKYAELVSDRSLEDLSGDTVLWNIMLLGYANNGCFSQALLLLDDLMSSGMEPDSAILVPALVVSSRSSNLALGKQIHSLIKRTGLEQDTRVRTALMDMYFDCGDRPSALKLFRRSRNRNPVMWGMIISNCTRSGFPQEALNLYLQYRLEDGLVNGFIVLAALRACSSLNLKAEGMELHGLAVKLGFDDDRYIVSALVAMYMKAQDVGSAEKAFMRVSARDAIMGNAMMTGYAKNDRVAQDVGSAKKAFMRVSARDAIMGNAMMTGYAKNDRVAQDVGSAKKAFMRVSARDAIMGNAMMTGYAKNDRVAQDVGSAKKAFMRVSARDAIMGNAMMTGYAKNDRVAQDVGSAKKAFMRVSARDAIMGNAMMTGYAKNDRVIEALKAFKDMQCHGIGPNAVTISSLLSICALISVGSKCREVHGYVIREGLDTNNLLVSNSLIATYAKSGDMKSSRTIFDRMKERDVVSWNNILLALGIHGAVDELFASFENMKAVGVKPDKVTFTCVLSACSHAGRLDDGLKYFRSMVKEYGIEAELEQCNCIVDLLGRAGYLKEAHDLILGLPSSDVRIWGSLLGACQIHGNHQLAELVLPQILELDPDDIGYRVLV
ncbi:Pentatricopeptide repeat-containing protein, partial [Drosera capensis]